MTNNPFESPAPVEGSQVPMSGIVKAPSGLSAIAIICIILGALGLFTTCFGLAAIAGQEYLQGLQTTGGDEAMEEFQQKINEMQKGYMIPNAIITGLNLIVAGLLFVGGIGVQTRKGWGAKLLSLGLMLAIFFCLIRLAFATYMQVGMLGSMKEALAKLSEDNPQGGQVMETVMNMSMYTGIAMGVVTALGLVAFYGWSWMHLKKDHIVSYLATLK